MIKTLEQCNQETNNYLKYHDGHPTEFDMSINDTSRDYVEAMHHANGACWLGKINLYDEDVKPHTLTKWNPDITVLNFEYSFVLPVHDTKVEKMINDRDNAPYNPMDNIKRAKEIIQRIHELDGVILIWT